MRGAILFCLLVLSYALAPAHAQEGPVVDWAQFRTGFEYSVGSCPCFRTTVAATLATGEVRVGDLVVGSDGFVAFRHATVPIYDVERSRLQEWVIGGIRALHGPTGLGVLFDGVTVGTRMDLGYSDVISTHVALLWRFFQDHEFSLQLFGGYGYDAYRLNLINEVERHRVTVGGAVNWDHENLRLRVRGVFAPDSGTGFAPESARVDARLAALLRFRAFEVWRMGVGLEGGFEHDPWRRLFGLAPDQLTAQFFIEVSGASELPAELGPVYE